MKKWIFFLAISIGMISCGAKKSGVPVIGFADAFQDNTIEQAKTGFFDALAKNGFSEKDETIEVVYRNAQGNIPTLTQIVNYFISEKVTLIATSPSLSTITAIQNTKEIPVFMMVSPTPELMKVNDANGNPPANLFGVADNLDYIDTSFLMIPKMVQPRASKLSVGMIYNQSEPQSVEAIKRIKKLSDENGINLVSLPVNSSADVKLVTASLLDKNVDVFFANPDNVVFSAFETIVQACIEKDIPIFTSEAGLVQRGAVAAFGADIYQWGYQAGEQAAAYLKTKSTKGLSWEMVKVRSGVCNTQRIAHFDMDIPLGFKPIQ